MMDNFYDDSSTDGFAGAPKNRERKLQERYNAEETKTLIEMIKEMEFLWNDKLPAYRDREMRIRSWEMIGAATHHTATDCKTMWNAIKSRYNTETRKVSASKNGRVYSPRWEFFNSLHFLSTIQRHSQGRNNRKRSYEKVKREEINTANSNYPIIRTERTISEPTEEHGENALSMNDMEQVFLKEANEVTRSDDQWKRSYCDYLYSELCQYSDANARKLKRLINDVVDNFEPDNYNQSSHKRTH